MIQLQDNNDVQFCNTTNFDNKLQKNLEHKFKKKKTILVLALGPKCLSPVLSFTTMLL